jgi:hypothetical protein
MKRKWNWPIWIGCVVAVGGLFSYEFFVQFPITRDFPWANLLLFGIGATLLLVGLFRAFGRPQLYRGKVFGSIFTAISFPKARSSRGRDQRRFRGNQSRAFSENGVQLSASF